MPTYGSKTKDPRCTLAMFRATSASGGGMGERPGRGRQAMENLDRSDHKRRVPVLCGWENVGDEREQQRRTTDENNRGEQQRRKE